MTVTKMPAVQRCKAMLILFALTSIVLTATPTKAQPVMTTPSGLKIIDTHPGTGASPKTGQTCVMHYTGWLYDNGTKSKKFDSSVAATSRSSSRSACTRSSPAGTKASRP